MKIKNIRHDISNELKSTSKNNEGNSNVHIPERYKSVGKQSKRFDLNLKYNKSEYGTSTFMKERGFYDDPNKLSEQ